MGIDFYDNVTQNSIPKEIIEIFKKYKINVPTLVSVKVEYGVMSTYVFDNHLEIYDDCTSDNHDKEIAIKKLIKNPNYYVDKYNCECLEYDRKRKAELNKLKNTTTIKNEEQSIKKLQEELLNLPLDTMRESKTIGIAIKIIEHRLNIINLKDDNKNK